MRLATFDIFDTTLIRRCGRPEVVFQLTALRLFPNREDLRTEYAIWRHQAAQKAGRDATIAEIYADKGASLFPGYSPRQLMEAEMAMEAEMLTVNPTILTKINELRTEGYTIKFLSDMYLPSSFLVDVLTREGCFKPGDEVIVSCEWNSRKDTGELYRKVREKYHPGKWIHFGDNRHSDYKMARKNGVKAIQVNTDFTPIEHKVMALATDARESWQPNFLAGIMRAARISLDNDPEKILAADYVASLYIPFVWYVIQESRRQGIKRLHFLSRDGYIMYRIAEALGIEDVELNYLFVSRKALMRAYLSEDGAERYLKIADRGNLIMRHVDQLLGQLQLPALELKDKYGITFDYKIIQTPGQQQDFIDKIFNNPDFTPSLIESYKEASELTEAYLQQEGLTDTTKQAMVDIGWLGTSRMMVNSILCKDINNTIPTFYVGVRQDALSREAGDFFSYFPYRSLSTEATGLIENYFSASPYPSTIGYQKAENGRIEPKFANRTEYKENSIINSNISVAQLTADMLKKWINCFDNEVLYRWANVTLASISQLKDPVDLTPLLRSADFDGTAMAAKLSMKQLVSMAFLGGRCTAFDRGSLALTVGSRLARPIWTLHTRTASLRSRLYNLYLRRKG